MLFGKSSAPLPETARETLARNGTRFFNADPVMLPMPGAPLFSCVSGLLSLAAEKGWSLGRAALASEASLLGVPEKDLMDEMERRLDIMLTAVRKGLAGDFSSMKLLTPMAQRLWNSEKKALFSPEGLTPGPPYGPWRPSTSALPAAWYVRPQPAVLPVFSPEWRPPWRRISASQGRGSCCPSGPPEPWGTSTTSEAPSRRRWRDARWRSGRREPWPQRLWPSCGRNGTAGVRRGGHSVPECHGVGVRPRPGSVEIPCHSRNASLASQAFLCADLVLGGYENPVPLDETIDAVDRAGRMLPEELRCTSRGGLALCPSALALPRLDTGTH